MSVEPPTDYTINNKTGQVTQVGETNNEPDRILKSNSRGEVKYKNNGEAKVEVDNIEKGILTDGMNLKTESNLVGVGGANQPTVEGVEKFAVQLTGIVNKEIGLGYFSKDDFPEITHMTIGAYGNNEYGKTTDFGLAAFRKMSKTVEEFKSYILRAKSHTHPWGKPSDVVNRFIPSPADKISRDRDLKGNPKLKFNILTMPEAGSGEKFPKKIPY